MLVTRADTELPDLNDETAVRTWLREKRIAVPGKMTSAFLSLGLYMGGFPDNSVVVPFDEIFDSVSNGDTDVGLAQGRTLGTWVATHALAPLR